MAQLTALRRREACHGHQEHEVACARRSRRLDCILQRLGRGEHGDGKVEQEVEHLEHEATGRAYRAERQAAHVR